MTYNQLWHSLTSIYDEGEAKAIVRTVLDDVFGLSMTDVYSGKVTQLSEEECSLLEEIMHRLQNSEPVQYVTGKAPFKGRTFKVHPGVLIPRPETEGLCQMIADLLHSDNNASSTEQTISGNSALEVSDFQPHVLDIGTGSGCIAITVALDCPEAAVTAWDVSSDALVVARDNAKRLKANVNFELHNALKAPHDLDKWDIIVSNPPYICERERASMAQNVTEYEPDIALFVPDNDALCFYRAIADYAKEALRPMGHLLFEINPDFADEIADLLTSLDFTHAEIKNDQFGRARYAICQKEKPNS